MKKKEKTHSLTHSHSLRRTASRLLAATESMDLGDQYGGTEGVDPDDALYDSLEWEQQCWLVINA